MSLLLTHVSSVTKHVTDTSGINHKNSNNLKKKKHLKQSFLLRDSSSASTRRMKLSQTHRAEVSLCAWICLCLTLFRFRRAAADPGGDAAGTGRVT